MRRAWTVLLPIVLAIAGAVFYLTRPGQAPAGQPPLVEITGSALAAFQAEFNRTSSGLRIVLLLSPT